MADNLEKINCPACGKLMEKIFMKEQGVYLDVCTNGCGGIFFDNREFQKFDEEHEDISAVEEALKDKDFKQVDTSEDKYCSVCGTKMVKHYASAKHEVEIDECYSCGSIFLDNDELIKIRSQYKNVGDRAEEVLKLFYQEAAQEIAEFDEKYTRQMAVPRLFKRLRIIK